MSKHKNHLAQSHEEDIPRLEPWLWVLASSVIPVVLALYAHSGFVIPSIVATVALFLTGLAMLRRDTVRRRREEECQHPFRKVGAEPFTHLELEGL